MFLSTSVYADIVKPFFGYWHQSPAGVRATMDHTNVVFIQAANPEQPLEEIAALHPTAKILFQFTALDMTFECDWNKCMTFNLHRVNEILNAVEQHVIKPYRNRLAAFLIADEPETNPLTTVALQQLVNAIRSRPAFDGIPLWINYDNVFPEYTNAEFSLTQGIDWISITPSYASEWSDLAPDFRYEFLLNFASKQNPKPKFVLVGDGWSKYRKDSEIDGSLSETGRFHLDKIEKLYNHVIAITNSYQIPIVGVIPFSWSFPGPNTLGTSHELVKNKWREFAINFIGGTNPVPVPVEISVPTPALPKCVP
jgi:hypothetical protein